MVAPTLYVDETAAAAFGAATGWMVEVLELTDTPLTTAAEVATTGAATLTAV